MLNISEGERAHVKCVADSVPVSNISWIEMSDKENKIKKQCDYEQECVLDVNTNVISKQYLVCAIRYLQLNDNKTLIVNIYKSSKQDLL
jgi:predicted DNA-binding ArsR family transcriptional regulator